MKVDLRQLQGEEMLEVLYRLNSYSLHPSPPYQNKDEWMAIVKERKGITCQAVYEDENAVSVAVSTPLTQNMRGRLFPTSGIWGVSTHPSARRKGYCRQLMTKLFSSGHEDGKVFSSLYPFRETFYERLGYVAYPLTKIARFYTNALLPTFQMNLGGSIRQQYLGEVFDEYRQYLSNMRQERHGMAMYDHGERARANQNLMWMAQAMFDGDCEGLMLYRVMGEEVSKYNFAAYRFYYQTSRARYLLLNWIARHIDQADRAELWLPYDEYPECWLSDLDVKVEAAVRPAMNRVLDIEKLGGMEVGEGSFSARIIDPLCPWNEAIWSFESSDGRLKVSRASIADCDLTIQGLSELIVGVRELQDIAVRSWGNPNPGLQTVLREMFPKMNPFMHELF